MSDYITATDIERSIENKKKQLARLCDKDPQAFINAANYMIQKQWDAAERMAKRRGLI